MDDGELGKPDHPVSPQKPMSTRKIRVTYEEYKTISNLLILHLRQCEESAPGKRGGGGGGGGERLVSNIFMSLLHVHVCHNICC